MQKTDGNTRKTILWGVAIVITLLLLGVMIVAIPYYFGRNSELPVLGEAPNFTLVNQDKENVSLLDYRGNVVLMAWIYTICPDIEFCPQISSDFKRIQSDLILGQDQDKVQLISVSFDPHEDTPEKLKEYGEGYDADLESWTFLTGSEQAINETKSLYNFYAEPPEGSHEHNTTSENHAHSTTQNMEEDPYYVHAFQINLIDAEGSLRKVYGFSDWDREQVIEDIESLIGEILNNQP